MKTKEELNALKEDELEQISGGINPIKSLKDKVIDAVNDTNTDVDRASIQKEIDESIAQIDDNALVTFDR